MKTVKIYMAFICCVLAMGLTCYGDNSPPHFKVSTTKDNMKIEDTVYLLVDLNDNDGFCAAQFCITYNKDKLLLEDVLPGELVPKDAITSVNSDIIGEINFSVISIQDITDSGTLLVAKFKAKDGGIAKFDFKLLAYADSDGISLNSTSSDAEIIVEENEESSEHHETPDDNEKKKTTIINSNSTGGASKPADVSPEDTKEPDDEPKFSDTDEHKDANKDEEKQDTQPDLSKEEKKVCFTDVTEEHWAYDQISKVAEMGLFSGMGENIFSPDFPMTRAMFVTVLYRYAGSPQSEKAEFTDVEENSWYTNAVSWASQNGIVLGTGDNRFLPNDYITRGQIATILCRYMNGKSKDIATIDSFNDSNTIPDWGKEPIAWAVEQGLIMGRTDGRVAFSDNATRAEAAVIFTRFLNINE